MQTLTDLHVYQRLSALAGELDRMAGEAASLVGATALQTASMSLRGMASAVYEHSLSQDDGT